MYFVYILQSQRTGRFYIGHTDNLLDRFNRHRAGRSKATKGRGPWWMPYYEVHDSRAEASQREREIKAWKSALVIQELITTNAPR